MALFNIGKKETDSKKMTKNLPKEASHIEQSSSKKFSQPKILLIDVDTGVVKAVKKKWESVVIGTLGTPYVVEKNAGYLPVIQHDELSEHEESDIVILDLEPKVSSPGPDGGPHQPNGETDLWAKCDSGLVDNRIRTVLREARIFNRIHASGGIFVIFAAAPLYANYVLGRVTFGTFYKVEELETKIWHITPELEKIDVVRDSGSTMSAVGSSEIEKLLSRYLPGSQFSCAFKRPYEDRHNWTSLAVNKFDQSVAMMRSSDEAGTIIILPQLADKAGFITELMETVLPDMAPRLFPEIEKGKWTHRPEYELQQIVELQAKKIQIEKEAAKALANLDAEISKERLANGWIHDLVVATGDPLVAAVTKALDFVGFQKIIDVDELRDSAGKSRREDLQINDQSPLLVIDIKGIGGYPSDDDAIQANKHVMINMKELNRTDIQGLSIINHQRHLPPLDRENVMPFRQELLTVADESGLGLMTTFDLYKIVVNATKHDWHSDDLRDLFYQKGRIQCIPKHYYFLGKIAKTMTGKIGVVIDENEIAVGETLSVEGEIFFEECVVESIQVDGEPKQKVVIGDRAGFLWPNQGAKLKEGMRVFVCRKANLMIPK